MTKHTNHSPADVDRALPHNLEAERSVLGAVLIHNDALSQAADILDPREFYRDAHRRIFEKMIQLNERGATIDFVTLKEELIKSGELDEVGGPAYVTSLVDGLPHATNIEQYAEIVKEKSRLRQAIAAATKLMTGAYSEDTRAADLATDAAERLYDLGAAATFTGPVSLSQLITPGMEAVEQAISRRGSVTGLSTGFRDLDDMTAGMHPGDLILIAARTSIGKTALAMNIARHVANTQTVLVFSLEMSALQLFLRLFSSEARVDSQRMRTGRLLDSDWPRLAHAMTTLANAKLFIDDTPGISIRDVRARGRQVRSEHGLGLMVVDYLQLMRGRGRFDNRTQEVGTISRGLKAVAKELGIPIVALAQLSRAPEGKFGAKGRRPQLSDLRESGDLENDADVVLLIYRPDHKPDDNALMRVSSLEAEVIVAKQRNGPTGSVNLSFIQEYVLFEGATA